jgi:hypothetical protein
LLAPGGFVSRTLYTLLIKIQKQFVRILFRQFLLMLMPVNCFRTKGRRRKGKRVSSDVWILNPFPVSSHTIKMPYPYGRRFLRTGIFVIHIGRRRLIQADSGGFFPVRIRLEQSSSIPQNTVHILWKTHTETISLQRIARRKGKRYRKRTFRTDPVTDKDFFSESGALVVHNQREVLSSIS